MRVAVSRCLLWLIILGTRNTGSEGGLAGLQADRKTPRCQDAFGQSRSKQESPGRAFCKGPGRRAAHRDPLLKGGYCLAIRPGLGETPLASAEWTRNSGREAPFLYPNKYISPPPPSQIQLGGAGEPIFRLWGGHLSQGRSPLVQPADQSSNFLMLEKQSRPIAAPELPAEAEQSRSTATAMKPPVLLLVCATVLLSTSGSPVAPADPIQIQRDFDEARVYGKWYAIALGTTCKWLKKYKEHYLMGTLMVAPGDTSNELSVTSTRLRQGTCSQAVGVYQKSSTPGKYHYYNSRWETHTEGYVARTNYDEYAFLAWKKNSSYGYTVTTQLYGRSPHLPQDLIEAFREFSVTLGIPQDSIFTLTETGECVPPQPELNVQRDRRSTWDEEAGSADGSPSFGGGNREDFCLQPKDAGPCLGMELRYFYNTTSQNCERFFYGGCRGNQNNFPSERGCLQTCRTEAACRLPIIPGEPCKDTFWAFDAKQGKCLTFRGCGGNANKFYLEKECQEYCGLLPSDGEEFLRPSAL